MKYNIGDMGADIEFGRYKEIIIFFTKDSITEKDYVGYYDFNINSLSKKQLDLLEEFIYKSINIKTDNIKKFIIDNFYDRNKMFRYKAKFTF